MVYILTYVLCFSHICDKAIEAETKSHITAQVLWQGSHRVSTSDVQMIYSRREFRGGAPGARPPVRPYMQEQKISLRPPPGST